MFSVRPSGRPLLFVNTYFAWPDISLPSGRISMKLATNIHHTSAHFWQGFQGLRSKIQTSGSGVHFNGVASRLTCFVSELVACELPGERRMSRLRTAGVVACAVKWSERQDTGRTSWLWPLSSDDAPQSR